MSCCRCHRLSRSCSLRSRRWHRQRSGYKKALLSSFRIKQLTQQREDRPRHTQHATQIPHRAPPPPTSTTSAHASHHTPMALNCRYHLIVLIGLLLLLQDLCTAAPAVERQKSKELPDAAAQPRNGARLLDRFNNRYPDGSYEFRFELDDGTARYERGYFVYIDEVKTLNVVGYYSYRVPDGRYITVFYNADQFGYRQNQSITPEVYPNLPRSIEVPLLKEATSVGQHSSPSTQQPQRQQQQPLQQSTTALPKPLASPTRRGRY